MNKVIVDVYSPMNNENYNIFLPVNEYVWKISKLIVKSINDLTYGNLSLNDRYILINKITGEIYDNNKIIINSNIRNNSKLIIMKI